jgi:hypothetical protein
MSWEAAAVIKQQAPLHEYLASQHWKPVRRMAGGRLLGLCPLLRYTHTCLFSGRAEISNNPMGDGRRPAELACVVPSLSCFDWPEKKGVGPGGDTPKLEIHQCLTHSRNARCRVFKIANYWTGVGFGHLSKLLPAVSDLALTYRVLLLLGGAFPNVLRRSVSSGLARNRLAVQLNVGPVLLLCSV